MIRRLLRHWVWPIVTGRTRRVALPIAAVVGSLLVALNQGSTIVAGHVNAVLLGRVLLNYAVPYVVSSVGYLRATWNDRPVTATPDLAIALDLQPHPEGGWFRETWRSPEVVTLPDGRERATGTLIWFLLPAGESSRWHKVTSDEIWLAHTGTVRLELGGDGPAPVANSTHEVTASDPANAQVLVPAGVWQRTVPGPEDALVRCLVSPGFDFADFELVD